MTSEDWQKFKKMMYQELGKGGYSTSKIAYITGNHFS